MPSPSPSCSVLQLHRSLSKLSRLVRNRKQFSIEVHRPSRNGSITGIGLTRPLPDSIQLDRCSRKPPAFSSSSSSTDRLSAISDVHNRIRVLLGRYPGDFHSDIWAKVLSESENVGERSSVAFYSLLEKTEYNDLLSLLFCDPLSTDEKIRHRMRERWRSRNAPVRFQYNPDHESDDLIPVSSSFLDALPTDFYELPPASTQYLHLLFSVDIPVVIVEPFTTSFDDIKYIVPPSPHAILIVNVAAGPDSSRHIEEAIIQSLGVDTLKVLFVDIEGGLRAVDAFYENPTALNAIQRFQNKFLASNVSHLQKTLQDLLKVDYEGLKFKSKLAFGQAALTSLRETVQQAHQQLKTAEDDANGMLASAAAQKKDLIELSSQNAILSSLKYSEEDLRKTLNSLSFWRLFILLDDLEYLVAKTLYQSHLQDLRDELLVYTGRLQAAQESVTEFTQNKVLRLSDKFDKALLANSLSRTASAPSYTIRSTLLSEPLKERISRLSYPTRNLQSRGRTLAVGVLSWTGLNIFAGYWGFMFNYIDAGTALGLAGLLGVAGLRIAVGRWEKAKLSWIEDYKRVIGGLKRDLAEALDRTLESQVLITQREASTSILVMVEKRMQETKELENSINALVSEIKAIQK